MTNPQTTKIDERDILYTAVRNESGEQFSFTHIPTKISVHSGFIGKDQSLHKAQKKLMTELENKVMEIP